MDFLCYTYKKTKKILFIYIGAVQLDDLILKKDVFNQFGLPLQLKKGKLFIIGFS